jgi:hypothetical protein
MSNFCSDQGEAEDQAAPLAGSSTRILRYVEDLSRGLNADIGRKDHFAVASNRFWEVENPSAYQQSYFRRFGSA